MRDPSLEEIQILRKLFTFPFKGNETAIQQLNGIKVQLTNDPDNYGSIYLYPSPSSPLITYDKSEPVVGNYIDIDNEIIEILLHMAEGRLKELEMYKFVDKPRYEKVIDAEKISLSSA